MQKILIIVLSIIFLSSCSSKQEQQDDYVVEKDSVQYNSTYTIPTTSPTYENNANESSPQSQIQQNVPNSSTVSDGDGYTFGYNMGVIAGQNNDPYNPYLPNTSNYPMAYRQAYCRGYDAGYQEGQSSAGRPSYYVNTGEDDSYEDEGEVYYYEEDDY